LGFSEDHDSSRINDKYVVEAVIGKRVLPDLSIQYKVHWRGYSFEEDSWVDDIDMNCPDLVSKYEKESPSNIEYIMENLKRRECAGVVQYYVKWSG
jgi:hypothetical protein